MFRYSPLALSVVLLSTTFGLLQEASACTGVRLIAKDKSVVYARTLEFAQDLQSEIIYIPKGVKYVGASETGVNNGKKWEVKYPVTGTSAFHLPYIVDGINSEGLAMGIFYFPNYAEFIPATPENLDKRIGSWELPTYILSQYANVEEVKKGLETVDVIAAGLMKGQPTLDVHYIVHDAKGNALVIEYVKGKLVTYNNPLGVITNAPTFDWHMTNLDNYVNLTVNNVPPVDLSGRKFDGLGQGTGLLGLPGDFTPPSRFVRAVVFSQSYLPADTGAKAVFDVFHILNQFDIPKGSVRGKDGSSTDIEYTQWTSAMNLAEKKYYYHTYFHRDVGMIDLMKMDPHAAKVEFFPMDKSVSPPDGTF